MKRKPFQGLATVLRFNWHFFALALAAIVLPPPVCAWLAPAFLTTVLALSTAGALVVATSLAATLHAYDLSGLYALDWIDPWMAGAARAANIHSGFDETSELLREKHPDVKWHIMDFYDPAKHTEVSIKRARTAHPPQPETRKITTSHIPLEDRSLDRVILMLAAHEIRSMDERIGFFRELRRVLADDGRVIVTEHLRDIPNLIAYTAGAWHFHPRGEWLATFRKAGFQILSEKNNNLFITTFTLRKDGTTS